MVVLIFLVMSGFVSGFSNTVPSAPELRAPANLQTDYTDGIFSWSLSAGTNVLYDLYVGTNAGNLDLFQAGVYDGFENAKVIVFSDGVDLTVILLDPLTGGRTYYWKVVARDDQGQAESVVWSFSTPDTNLNAPTVPANPAPASGADATSSAPWLAWSESTDIDGDVVSYSLYLDTLPNPSKKVADNLAHAGFRLVSPLKGNKTYYWKVTANDGRGKESEGPVWNFRTPNALPVAPEALFPTDAATGIRTAIELSWSRAFDADNDIDHYELWYGTTSSMIQSYTTTGTSGFLYLNAGTKYYWKVVVIDKHGARTTSNTWTFITQAVPANGAPAVPVIRSPLNQATGVGVPAVLSWEAPADPDNDAVFYDVYFGTAAATLQRVASGLNVAEFVPAGTALAKTYYWKVVATDRKGGVSQSDVFRFTTTSADVNITGLSVYYRYSHLTELYEYTSAALSPSFSKGVEKYEAKGKTTMTGVVALVLNYTGTVNVSVDVPRDLTVSSSSPYVFGLPANASAIYYVSGTFATHNAVTVKVTTGSVTRSYTIDLQINQLPGKPELHTPANGAGNVVFKPTFTWRGGQDPDGIRTIYRLFLGTSEAAMGLSGTIVNDTLFAYSATPLLGNTKYYWKVVAQDVNSESTESAISSFVTAGVTDGASPVLKYPRAISTYMDVDFDLLWSYDNTKQARYDVYLATQNPPVKVAENVAAAGYAVRGLPYATTYYWKVVAHNADGTTTESPVQKFRTKPRDGNVTGSFTDTRDGQIYQWVQLGNEQWMVHNLAYKPVPADGYSGYSYVFDETTHGKEYFMLKHDAENLRKYGYLYNWSGALNASDNPVITVPRQGVCPAGWSIPTQEQWNAINPLLGGASGSDAVAANTIFYDTWSAASGKESSWLNASGLSILPSGIKIGGTIFDETNAGFWLANIADGKGLYVRYNYASARTNITQASDPITQGAVSVRCVRATNRAPIKTVLRSPLHQSTGQAFTTKLQWDAATDADGDAVSYTVYVDTNATPVQKIASGITTVSLDVKALKQNTTYYWKVVAADSRGATSESDVWRFTTQPNTANAAPRVPALTQPADNATAVAVLPVLRWNTLSDSNGDAVFARVYIGRSASTLDVVAGDLTATQYTPAKPLASNTEYYWQVLAYDNKGGVTASAVRRFTTGNQAPPKPELLTPANNANWTFRNLMLTWKPVIDPDGDNVTYTVYTGSSSTTLTAQATGIAVNYYEFGFADTPVDTDFYWKVVATDANGVQTSSDTWRFHTYVTDGGTNPGITLVSPADRATNVDVNPVLTWNPYGQNAKYDVYLQEGTSVWALVASDVTATSLTISNFLGRSSLLSHTAYNWQVVYKETSGRIWASTVRTFTTRNLPPVKPVLTAPANQATQQPYTLTLQWQPATDVDGDKLVYDVYLGTATNPTQSVATNLTQTQFVTAPYAVLPGVKYYWKVVAKDSYAGATSSDVWSLTVQNTTQNEAPSIPVLVMPRHYSESTDIHPVFSWEAGKDLNGDALTYDFYLDVVPNLQTPLASGLTALTYGGATLTLAAHTTYYWKVVTRDGKGGITAGPVWQFTTPNRNPDMVTLITPTDDAKLQQPSIALSWTPSEDPDYDPITYDVYMDENAQPVTRVAQSLRTNSYTTPVLANNKTYYWKIVVNDSFGGQVSSAVRKFHTLNDNPSVPVLVSPGNNLAVGSQAVLLSWLPAIDPEGGTLAYEVYLDNTATPKTKIGTVYNGTALLTPALAVNTTWYWKVVAVDNYGGAAESDTWRITYQPGSANQPPVNPRLTYPQDQSTLTSPATVLQWESSSDPEGDNVLYDVYVTGSSGTEKLLAGNWAYTKYPLYDLAAGTVFSWRVVAKDNTGSNSSVAWTFTTPGVRYFTVSGSIQHLNGDALPGVLIQGFPANVYTQADGRYAVQVPAGWAGTLTPLLSPYQFSPQTLHVAAVQAEVTGMNFIASEEALYTVSGTVTDDRNNALANAVLSGFPGTVSTNAAGQYTATVPQNWSGTVSPVLAYYTFTPSQRSYTNVQAHRVAEDYQAVYTGTYTISGTVSDERGEPVPAIALNFEQGTVQTDPAGNYTFEVAPGWSGTVTPVSNEYTFVPERKTYTDVREHQTAQHYTATVVTGVGDDVGYAATIYPNPAIDAVHIELARPLKSEGVLVVYTANGHEAARYSVASGTSVIRWSAADGSGKKLHAGLYYCRVLDSTKNVVVEGKVMIVN